MPSVTGSGHSAASATKDGTSRSSAEIKIFLAYPASDRQVDGIRDYSTRVLEQLQTDGDAAVLLRPPRGLPLGHVLVRALPRHERAALVIQYNPFSWGRRGFAPWLLLALVLVRLLRPKARIVLTIHEAYPRMVNFRWLVMGLWQRAQMRILLGLAHSAVAAEAVVTARLSRVWPRCAISHLPISSNLPDERASRRVARTTAGLEGRLVIATFTAGHVSHLHGHVTRAVEAVAHASSQPVVLLLLGSQNLPPREVPGVERSIAPGYLDEQSLAQALASADIFLGPFADGASTRRGTLMAALQHGLAIVTTTSDRTDQILVEGGALAFAAADDADGFAAEAVRVGVDPRVREQHALASRALFDRYFSWPIVCAGLRVAIAAAFASPPNRHRLASRGATEPS